MSTNQEKPQHTPGPWRADLSELTEDYNICSTAPGQVLNLAAVHSYHDDAEAAPTWEAKANAALITAAPELLASLREVLGWLNNWDNTADSWPPVELKALEAITKAGSTPIN